MSGWEAKLDELRNEYVPEPVRDLDGADRDESIAPDGFRLTDTGNSGRFTKLTKGTLKHAHAWGKWLHLQRGRWMLDEGEVLVKELGKQVGKNILKLAAEANLGKHEAAALFNWGLQTESSGRITAMVHLSRGSPGILVEHEELDANPDILNVLNGTIDLRSGELRGHDPADLCTLQTPVDYDPDARSDLWASCLETWQPDPEMRDYLQLEAGAAATGYSTETLSVHYGPGANGKSRLWGAIADTLGPYAVVPHKSLLVAQKYEQHGTETAKLFRKRLAVASETDAGARLADEKIKNLTGNDRLSGRRMREDPWGSGRRTRSSSSATTNRRFRAAMRAYGVDSGSSPGPSRSPSPSVMSIST